MVEKDANAAFVDAFAAETEPMLEAREASEQFGITPVAPSVGAQLAVVAAGGPARTIIELGTGAGVSGLWLLRGAPEAQLTTIDEDLDHQQVARGILSAAGYAAKQLRFIPGRASDVLPRMNEESYDLVFVDANPDGAAGYVDHALRLVRRGGIVLVAHVLQGGRVAQASRRDAVTTQFRNLLRSVRDRDDLLASISPVGDGLLHLVRR
jgi:predicted O-methyltransferase YrrM